MAALASLELRLLARRGENVLVALVVPVAVLLFFGGTSLGGMGGGSQRGVVAGTVALAIMAAGLVNLGIATAYERHYGVLKRLGGAPLPRWGFLAAKLIAVLVLEVVQLAVLAIAANLAFGWTPGPAWQPALALAGVLLGTVGFVALGLLLAGTLRAEAVLALANGLFLGFLLLGGILVPVEGLPELLQPLAMATPSAALADLIRIALDSGAETAALDATAAVLVLGAWALGATILTLRRFRWD